MNKEIINPNFDINAKCQSMIEEANKIIKVYLETSNLYENDGRYSLAYDVKNYLPKLQQERDLYKSIIERLNECINLELKQRQSNLSTPIQLTLLRLSKIISEANKGE